MNPLQIIVLAIIQGLTEFLPVSSSGHLVLLKQWFGSAEGNLFLVVVLHGGTLGSVLWIYRREVRRLLCFDRAALRYLVALAIGTLPAVAIGLLLADTIERLFQSTPATAVALLITALLLFSSRFARPGRSVVAEGWQPVPPSPVRALLIGVAQAVAITPGISRSGATITASLWAGLPRAEAARFSFLLSVPAIAGALLLELIKEDWPGQDGLWVLPVAAIVAFLVGLVAIHLTAKAVLHRHFWKFGFYCLVLGAAVLLIVDGS